MGYNFSYVHNAMNLATADKARLKAEIAAIEAKPEFAANEDVKRMHDVLSGVLRSLNQLMDIIDVAEF